MNTVELKKYLVSRITEIHDEAFLEAIKTILDSKSQSQILPLTEDQRLEIMESKKQIEQGLFLGESEMDQEFEKWLSEK
jgi:Mn-containing catalase